MDVIAALQNSIEIAGKLRALAKKAEDADFRMLVADLSNELADAKLEVAGLKEELAGARTSLFKDLQAELKNLKEENESIRAQLKARSRESADLNRQVEVLNERLNPTAASQLDALQERILLILAERDDYSQEALIAMAGVDRNMVIYNLEELRIRNFATAASDWLADPPPTEWSIAHAGREYLIRRRHLK